MVETKELSSLPTSRAGAIYVSTIHDTPATVQDSMSGTSKTTTTGEGEGGEENITSFLIGAAIPELDLRLRTDLLLPPPKPPSQSLSSEEDPEVLTNVPAGS